MADAESENKVDNAEGQLQQHSDLAKPTSTPRNTSGDNGSGGACSEVASGEALVETNGDPTVVPDADSGSDSGSDAGYGGYAALPMSMSSDEDEDAGNGYVMLSVDEDGNVDSDNATADRGGSIGGGGATDNSPPIPSEFQALADAQLMGLERDYMRTIAASIRSENDEICTVSGTEGTAGPEPELGAESDAAEVQPADLEFAVDFDELEAESAAVTTPQGNANAGSAVAGGSDENIQTTKQNQHAGGGGKQKKRKGGGRKKRRQKKNKNKKSHGNNDPSESSVERRNRRLLEAARIELLMQRVNDDSISAHEPGNSGSTEPEPEATARPAKPSTVAAATTHTVKGGGGKPRAASGPGDASSIKAAMAGFELKGAPEWARNSDIEKVITQFCDLKLDSSAAPLTGPKSVEDADVPTS